MTAPQRLAMMIIVPLLGVLGGNPAAWGYEDGPGVYWDGCAPACRELPARCGDPVEPESLCEPEPPPEASPPRSQGRDRSDRTPRWPVIPEWWTRDFSRRLTWIALAVLGIGLLLLLLFRVPLFRIRLAPAGSGGAPEPSAAPPPPRRPGDRVLVIMRIVATLLSIALIALVWCQNLGLCSKNDALQRIRDRLIEIPRWFGWI